MSVKTSAARPGIDGIDEQGRTATNARDQSIGAYRPTNVSDLCDRFGEAMATAFHGYGGHESARLHSAARLRLIEAVHGRQWYEDQEVVLMQRDRLLTEIAALKAYHQRLGRRPHKDRG